MYELPIDDICEMNTEDVKYLLDSPIESSATSIHWSEKEVREMGKLVKYHTDMITYITTCRASGPSREPPPKKSRSDILKKMYSGSSVRKQDTIPVSEMTGEEFHGYLSNFLSSSADKEMSQGNRIPEKLNEIATYLDQEYKSLKYTENKTLKAHIQWCKYLNAAKDKFDCEKRKKRMRQTWRMWLEEHTHIKEACARRHREIASLVTEYPKLENLQLPYADFLKLKNKIKEVFSENSDLGEQWKK